LGARYSDRCSVFKKNFLMAKRKTSSANTDLPPLTEEESRLCEALRKLPASIKKDRSMAVLHQERIAWCRQNKPKPEARPVLAVIFDAYIVRMEEVLEKWNPTPTEVRWQIKVWDELIELQGWIHMGTEKWEKWTQDHDDSAGNVLVKDFGKSYSEAKSLIRRARKLSGGRPGTSRVLSVKGLELKVLHPELRWVDVRDLVCDCGQRAHGDSCLSKLKSALTQLRAMLRRYGLTTAITRRGE
jgi:hypothetical protein